MLQLLLPDIHFRLQRRPGIGNYLNWCTAAIVVELSSLLAPQNTANIGNRPRSILPAADRTPRLGLETAVRARRNGLRGRYCHVSRHASSWRAAWSARHVWAWCFTTRRRARRAAITLPTGELIADVQPNGSGPTHRDGFVPLRVVRIEFGPRVGQILSVDLREPRVLSDTERRIIRCETAS